MTAPDIRAQAVEVTAAALERVERYVLTAPDAETRRIAVAAVVADALAEAGLLLPSPIIKTEYAYRYIDPAGSGWTRYPADGREDALAEAGEWKDTPRNEGRVVAEERPVLDWLPIREVSGE